MHNLQNQLSEYRCTQVNRTGYLSPVRQHEVHSAGLPGPGAAQVEHQHRHEGRAGDEGLRVRVRVRGVPGDEGDEAGAHLHRCTVQYGYDSIQYRCTLQYRCTVITVEYKCIVQYRCTEPVMSHPT